MTRRRVVVTGLGAVTPLGVDVVSTWNGILAGRSGAATVEFDTSELTTTFACTVKNFDPSLAMSAKEAKRMDTFIHYGAEAARQAIIDSGLEITDAVSRRTGTAIGSGIGGLPWIERAHDALLNSPRKISPFFIPGGIINMASGYVAMQHKLRGPNIAVVTACTTVLVLPHV